MGVYHGFDKNETTTMFFLNKPSLVNIVMSEESTLYEINFYGGPYFY